MTSIERTAYPRFKRQFTAKELTEIYTPSKSEIAFAYATTKGESNILNLVVILKAFQAFGVKVKVQRQMELSMNSCVEICYLSIIFAMVVTGELLTTTSQILM